MSDIPYKALDDRALASEVARLEVLVRELEHAQTETGLRIRLAYRTQLDEARLEAARRSGI